MISQYVAVVSGKVKTIAEAKALTYYFFASKFGWTPEQVDKLSRELVERFMIIAEAVKVSTDKEMRKIGNA